MKGLESDLFQRYPELANLRGKVPDPIIEREVVPKAEAFEAMRPAAERLIPTARLGDVFPGEAEQGAIRLERFLGQWGNIRIEEVCKLCLIVAWLRPRGIFELGTYNGMTTLQLALNAPAHCRIYTLDLDPESPEARTLAVGEIDGYLARKDGFFRVEVGGYWRQTPHASRITQLWGDSVRTDFSAYEGRMDLVFVDAGHTYPYVRADSENAFKMLRPGGVIVWHDYMQVLHPDVTRCLMQYAERGRSISHLRGTHLAVYRDPREGGQ